MGSTDPSPLKKGRQIVFVRPHSVVQNQLLGVLIRNEFAVAVLNDHTKVRHLFRVYPDCISFLNIDEGYSEPQWEALVRETNEDPATAGVGLGIVSYNANPQLSHKYLLDLMVSCGFVKLSLELTESTNTILRVLEASEAKGRRQYIRVPCIKGSASLNVLEGGETLNGTLVDISSVGMACQFDRDPGFMAHTRVKSIQLKLRGVLCSISAVVMGSRPVTGRTVYILLFDPNTGDASREKVRGFVRKSLQAQLEADLETVS